MQRKPAFTLVELLVVIAIIGMLTAILLPAVNSVRESARLVTCKNRLRQQALGIRSYAQNFSEALPAIWQRGETKPWENFSWRVTLLPYIEEDSRYDRLNQSLPPLDPKNRQAGGTMEIYNCPSSPGSPRVIRKLHTYDELELGATDYVAVFDVRGPFPPQAQSGAWFGGAAPDSLVSATEADRAQLTPGMAVNPDIFSAEIRKIPSTLRHVRDGLSNTVLIVEQAGKPNRKSRLQVPPEGELPTEGAWVTSEYASFFAAGVNQDNHSGPYGFHNGASVAMCDGSVHFWPREIAQEVMVALLTREGSEIVSDNDW